MTELALPKIDKATVSRKNLIVSDLKKFTKEENILSENDEIKPYETDALAAYKERDDELAAKNKGKFRSLSLFLFLKSPI